MVRRVYDFDEQVAFSRGQRQITDIETLKCLFHWPVIVRKTDELIDRCGVDYIVTLRGGATVNVDAKTRFPGCSKYWRNGPEVALEKWSVMPGGKYQTHTGKIGWTLNESTDVDYILFTFSPSDCADVYMLPFQLLRLAFRAKIGQWMSQYKVDVQDSKTWESQAVFVPISVVQDEIERAGTAVLRQVEQETLA